MRFAFLSSAILGLAACTQITAESLPGQPVDSTYTVRGSNRLAVAAKAFSSNGMVGVCGAWAQAKIIDPYQETFIDQYVSSSSLRLDGRTIVSSLTDFSKVTFLRESGPSGLATCFQVDVPWKAGYKDMPLEFVGGTTQRVIWD